MVSKQSNLTFYPFAYALLDDELENYCWYCLGERCEENLLRKCSSCKTALFCDKTCQLNGWQDHKAECKGLTKKAIVPDVEVRMLGRIVRRYKLTMAEDDSRRNPSFYINRQSRRVIMEICDHAKDMRQDKKATDKFQSIYQKLKTFYDKKFLTDEETVFQLHCRNYINRHGISDKSYLKEIGKGLYLDLCAYDHSCRPNTIYTCDGIVATLRPLNETVQIHDTSRTFYTYIDLLMCKQQRRKALKDSWYFHCQCERCQDESEHVLTSVLCSNCQNAVCVFENEDNVKKNIKCEKCSSPVHDMRVQEALVSMRFIDDMLNQGDLDELHPQDAFGIISNLLQKYQPLLHRSNVYYVRLLQALILRSDQDDIETLLKYHLEATDCMRVCYPANHPALAYHLLNIGIFYGKLEKFQESSEFLTEAKEMLKFVLGLDHSMTKQALHWLEQCNGSSVSTSI